MPTYVYENAAGERREIVASMTDAPPEEVLFTPAGEWMPHKVKYDPAKGFRDEMTDGQGVFRRVFEPCRAPHVPDAAVKRTKGGLPVSRFLPLQKGGTVTRQGGQDIKVHANGLRTDLKGRVIVANKSDVAAVKRMGWERE